MQTPCDADFCLSGGMHADEDECPGSDDETHHCVDCGQLWWTDKASSCNQCGDYWCPDWQQTFAGCLCSHLEEIYEGYMDASEENELTGAFDALAEPMCATCLLRTPIDCKVEGCEWSRAEILNEWIKFCKQPIVHSWATLERRKDKLKVEICYVRKERNPDDAKVIESWDIDFNVSILKINGVEQRFNGKHALDEAIKEAKKVIAEHEAEGFKPKSPYGSGQSGALRKPTSRDSSPKRKVK